MSDEQLRRLKEDNRALQARIDAYEGEMQRWEEMERLIEASSLGTPEAKALRDRTPPDVGKSIVIAVRYAQERDEALDALEGMVTQHLGTEDGTVEHWHMATNEQACEVLVRLRPERWQATNVGIERVEE